MGIRYSRTGYSKIHYWIDQLKWFFFHRFHPKHRYHVLKLQSKYDEYRYGWLDADHAMELACFNLLVRFVEKEKGLDVIKWKPTGGEDEWDLRYFAETGPIHDTILEIYTWWTKERREEQRAIDILCEKLYSTGTLEEITHNMTSDDHQRLTKMETDAKLRADSMLKRLIEIRHYLWT